jgi:hypothetical protein
MFRAGFQARIYHDRQTIPTADSCPEGSRAKGLDERAAGRHAWNRCRADVRKIGGRHRESADPTGSPDSSPIPRRDSSLFDDWTVRHPLDGTGSTSLSYGFRDIATPPPYMGMATDDDRLYFWNGCSYVPFYSAPLAGAFLPISSNSIDQHLELPSEYEFRHGVRDRYVDGTRTHRPRLFAA